MTNPPQHRRGAVWLATLLLLAAPGRGRAQTRMMVEEPQLLKMRSLNADLEVEAETRDEERTPAGSDRTFRRERSYLNPALRLAAGGSVYHPNFLTFDVFAREGLYWDDVRTYDPELVKRRGSSFLQAYDARLTLLKQEPYAAKLFASRQDMYRDYDFFSRVKVDDQRYGGTVGYRTGPIPFTLTASHHDETVDDTTRPSTLSENTVQVDARNRRRTNDATEFSYFYNQFARDDRGIPSMDGTQQSARLADAERFGADGRSSLASSVSYNRLRTSEAPQTYWDVQEGLALQHSTTLRSTYDYAFDARRNDDSSGDRHYGRMALEHQLYESLWSTVDAHGSTDQSSGHGGASDLTIYGVGVNERYSKHLGSSAQLRMGIGGQLDRREQSGSGAAFAVVGESHVLADGTTVFLDQPVADLSSIRVEDATGTLVYREVLDYRLIPQGTRVEIQRVTGGTIPNGATLRVHYTAASQPSADYYQRTENYFVRLDLLDGLLGLYAQSRRSHSYGDSPANVEQLDDRIVGADVAWRWLRAGGSYEDHDSSLTPFRVVRLDQSLSHAVTRGSTLSISANESKFTYLKPDRTQDSFEIVARYRVRLTSHLGFDLEAGRHVDRGPAVDRRLTTVRSGFDFVMNQLTMRLSYDLQDETYLDDLRVRKTIHLSARRTF